jgi:hypothetical protein
MSVTKEQILHSQLSGQLPLASQTTLPKVQESQERSPWIIGPIIDLLFVAGGIPIILIAVTAMLTSWQLPEPFLSYEKQLSGVILGLVLVGQHLFANSHNIATFLRIWGSDEDRGRFRFYRTWLVALFLPFFVWGLYSPTATGTFVYLFLMAVFWHYAAQCYGVALIYCYKRDYILRPIEKQLMKFCMTSLSAFAILRILSFREYSPYEWYGVPMPFWGPLPSIFFQTAAVLFALSVMAFGIVIVVKFFRERKVFPLPSLMVLLTVVALGLTESSTNALLWFYVPPFFHGTQYLAISLSYALKEREELQRITLGTFIRSPLVSRLFAITVIVGALLYVVIPQIFVRFGYDYATVAGLILAIVNFHHFLTDAAIWKLRDPRCRKILLA